MSDIATICVSSTGNVNAGICIKTMSQGADMPLVLWDVLFGDNAVEYDDAGDIARALVLELDSTRGDERNDVKVRYGCYPVGDRPMLIVNVGAGTIEAKEQRYASQKELRPIGAWTFDQFRALPLEDLGWGAILDPLQEGA